MVRFRLKTLLLVVAIVALFATGVKKLSDWNYELSSEYATAEVIREVTKFVETHGGQWPRSWDDIPSVQYAARYVQMDFDLDVNELVDDPALIHSVIVPKSGVYRTYPHAETDLNRLRETLAQFRP